MQSVLELQLHKWKASSEDESACSVSFGPGISEGITMSGSAWLRLPPCAMTSLSRAAYVGATRCVLAHWSDVLDEGLNKHSLCCCCEKTHLLPPKALQCGINSSKGFGGLDHWGSIEFLMIIFIPSGPSVVDSYSYFSYTTNLVLDVIHLHLERRVVYSRALRWQSNW